MLNLKLLNLHLRTSLGMDDADKTLINEHKNNSPNYSKITNMHEIGFSHSTRRSSLSKSFLLSRLITESIITAVLGNVVIPFSFHLHVKLRYVNSSPLRNPSRGKWSSTMRKKGISKYFSFWKENDFFERCWPLTKSKLVSQESHT